MNNNQLMCNKCKLIFKLILIMNFKKELHKINNHLKNVLKLILKIVLKMKQTLLNNLRKIMKTKLHK